MSSRPRPRTRSECSGPDGPTQSLRCSPCRAKEAGMTRGRVWMWSIAVSALLAAGAASDRAVAAMVKLSVAQLAVEADTIVLGTVIGRVSTWNPEHTAILTQVTVSVERVLKGSPGHEVTFQVRGGEIGGLGMQTSVDPSFHLGERAVLFLDTSTTPATLTGLRQGKSAVRDGHVRRDGKAQPVGEFLDSVRAAVRR